MGLWSMSTCGMGAWKKKSTHSIVLPGDNHM